jgi:hypothetical protein
MCLLEVTNENEEFELYQIYRSHVVFISLGKGKII